MKKGVFIFSLLILLGMFLYSPSTVKGGSQCTDFDNSSCPSPDCKLESRTVPVGAGCSRNLKTIQLCVVNPEVGFCYPGGTANLITSGEQPSISANFRYSSYGQ